MGPMMHSFFLKKSKLSMTLISPSNRKKKQNSTLIFNKTNMSVETGPKHHRKQICL